MNSKRQRLSVQYVTGLEARLQPGWWMDWTMFRVSGRIELFLRALSGRSKSMPQDHRVRKATWMMVVVVLKNRLFELVTEGELPIPCQSNFSSHIRE